MDKKSEKKSSIMHKFNTKDSGIFNLNFVIILIIVIILGAGTGYMLKKSAPGIVPSTTLSSPTDKNAVVAGKSYGSNDTSSFKDTAEGTLKEGGIGDEGQFHLERPGGESQNVYLTSSIVDLSLFINRKIKIWGETQKAQKAGWLMDVGKVEVLK